MEANTIRVVAKTTFVNPYWMLAVECPWCGDRHLYNGGDGTLPELGVRKAHCGKAPPTFTLEADRTPA